jgi:hypothetical protein
VGHYGLSIGSKVENATFRTLARGQLADLIWEAPAAFTQNLWSDAWSANHQALELMQQVGLTRFSPAKPQRWVIASFPHHSGPHGVAKLHVHNIVITELTRAAASAPPG